MTTLGGVLLILTNELKGKIISKGFTQDQIAKTLGMTPKTFYSKMKKGVFDSDEIQAMIEILEIDKPLEIFFASNVTHQVTRVD